VTRLFRALVTVSLMAAACDDPSVPTGPTSSLPATGALTGTWAGTLTDGLNGSGALRLVLEERPIDGGRSLVTGIWSASFPQAARLDSGTFAGTGEGSEVLLGLTPATRPACAQGFLTELSGSFTLALQVRPGFMTGTSRYVGCEDSAVGRVELARQ
jgi:hypothetical protein